MPCLSASASMPHARGETHAAATRADLPSPKRPGSVDGAGPALFIPDQDIRACLSVARSARVHRPARVEESRWSRAPSDFRGSSLRLAARRADPQDRTPFVCGRRFPAPRIARTEEIARGGDGEGPLRVVDRFFGKLSPRDSRGLRASVPLSRALPTERACPRFVFCLPRNFTVFAPRTHMDVSQAGLGPHERRGLPHPGVRGERAEILQTPVPQMDRRARCVEPKGEPNGETSLMFGGMIFPWGGRPRTGIAIVKLFFLPLPFFPWCSAEAPPPAG